MQQALLRFSQSIVTLFTRLCAFCWRRPWLATALLLALLLPLASQLPKLTKDGSIEGFLRSDDAQRQAYDRLRRQFGQDAPIIIGIETTRSIFEPSFMRQLSALHQALERVPRVEDITSLHNAREVQGSGDNFLVQELLAHPPSDAAQWQALERKVRAHPIYQNLLLTADAHMTVVMIKPARHTAPPARAELQVGAALAELQTPNPATAEFLSAAELGTLVAEVKSVAERFAGPDFRLHIAGSPVASQTIVQLMGSDMGRFMGLSVLVMLVLIGALTRRVSSALLAALVIALTLVSTFGLMAATHTPIKPPTQVLLSIILVASVCELIHIMTQFFQALDGGCDKHSALMQTVQHSAVPVLYTSLTTAAGMLAFCSSPLAPIADLGWFGAAAVLLAMVFTWTVVSLAVRWLPLRAKPGHHSDAGACYRWVMALAMFSHRRPRWVLAAALPLLCLMAWGISQVRFSHNSLLWLPADNPVRMATQTLDRALNTSVGLEIVVDSGRAGGVKDHAFLTRLEAAAQALRTAGARGDLGAPAGKVLALTDILKEINQAMHGGATEAYRLPAQALIEQEFVLFENSSSDDVLDFTDSRYQITRLTLRLPWLEAGRYKGVIERVEALMGQHFTPAQISTSGSMALLARTSANVMRSMADSYLNSMVLIPVMMMLLLASVRLGLLSMVPNVLPIAMVLAVMGFLQIPLDTFSMLAGSIALGLIVDDSVHFFHNYSHFLRTSGDVGLALRQTMERTGRSMVHATVVLCAAFSGFMASSLHNVRGFGIVMVVTIGSAMLFDLLISPALLTLTGARLPLPNPTLERQHA